MTQKSQQNPTEKFSAFSSKEHYKKGLQGERSKSFSIAW
jgi:hypothetical protein